VTEARAPFAKFLLPAEPEPSPDTAGENGLFGSGSAGLGERSMALLFDAKVKRVLHISALTADLSAPG
jgi:hypothetical protein